MAHHKQRLIACKDVIRRGHRGKFAVDFGGGNAYIVLCTDPKLNNALANPFFRAGDFADGVVVAQRHIFQNVVGRVPHGGVVGCLLDGINNLIGSVVISSSELDDERSVS